MAVTPLPNGFKAIEVDAATRRVFVSSPASSVVTALGFGGEVEDSVTVPGAGALVVDGSTLYVASTTAGRIDAFDTATLAPVATYGGGSLLEPDTLVRAGGRLWTSTGACGSSVRLVSIDPATGVVTTHPSLTWLSSCPSLHASPTDPNLVLGFDTGLSPTTLVRLDVSGGAPAVTATLRTDNSNSRDGKVLPDGRTFALGSGSPYEIRTFGIDPLQPHGVIYPTGHYPNAVESTSASGGLVAAGRDAVYENDIDVFRLGDPSAPVFQHDFDSTSDTVKDGGLAFSPDGTRLFVVSGSWSGDTAKLNVFDLFDPSATETAVSASPSYASQGEPVAMTATVTPAAGGPATGTVSFFEGATLRGTSAVDGTGRATLVLSSLAVTARYSGSATFAPSSGTTSMRVRASGATDPMAVTPLPDGFGAVEVDAATGRVFVSSPASSVVTVLDDGGDVLGSVTVPGAGALLLDGPTLYVISTTGGRIDAFDTTTLAPTATYGAGSLLLKPDALVKAGGRLWTSTGVCGSSPRVVSIDPGSGVVTTHASITWLNYCPSLFTSPTDANLVLGYDKGLSPSTVVRLDVSGAAPSVTATLRTDNSNTRDAEVLPDGQTFALASGAPYEIRTFRVDPLQPNGVVYPTGYYPNAVESTSANGGLVAAGRDAVYENDVDVFRLGDPSAPLLRDDFGSTADTVEDGGLAFSPDGRRLFVVTGYWSDGTARMNVFNLVDPATVTTLTASPAVARVGEPVTLTATVTSPAPGPITGDVTFSEGATVLGTAPVDASGRATLVLTSLAAGAHAITARYGGDAIFAPSSASASVTVQAATAVALATSADPAVWGQALTLTATVTASGTSSVPNGAVNFYDAGAYLGTGSVNAAGAAQLVTTSLEVGGHSLTATYTGSATFEPATSPARALAVQKAPSATSLTSSAASVPRDTPVTFTAVVARAGAGAGGPTGSVTFRRGASALGTVALQNGRASLTVTLAPGTHSITAAYGGDTHFLTSTSPALIQEVKKGRK